MSPFTLLSFTHSEQSRIKRSSGCLRFGSRHHVDLQLTLQSGAVNKGWQHVGVLNLIKAKDGSIRNECSSAMLRAESHFSVYGGVCNSLSAPCVGVALCSDQITHPWTFQLSSPERQAAPFAPVELHPRSLWLIALALSNWPAFSLQGKTERRGVSLPPAGIGGSFYTLSDKSVVWLENNHQKKKKTNMSLFLFMSRISPDKACSAQPLLFIHRTDASGPPALWMLSHTHLWSGRGAPGAVCLLKQELLHADIFKHTLFPLSEEQHAEAVQRWSSAPVLNILRTVTPLILTGVSGNNVKIRLKHFTLAHLLFEPTLTVSAHRLHPW